MPVVRRASDPPLYKKTKNGNNVGDMMGNLISDEIMEEVRHSLDLVTVISERINLKKAGRNYVGFCPFHQEKTPSFTVSPEKQIYHCFGCGQGGDLFSFIMDTENVAFPEAVKMLARKAGIHIPEKELTATQQEQIKSKEELRRAMLLAANLYHYLLVDTPFGKEALAYLRRREVTPDAIKRFGIGFAPESWTTFLSFARKKKLSQETLFKAGLTSSRPQGSGYFDRFRKRIIFPIHDHAGQVIGLGGRTLGDGEPKYLNSPQTPLFDKSKCLYGFNHARSAIRKKGFSLIFEGYMDVIIAHQQGIDNVVASLGTSLTMEQARLLKAQAEEVIIVYDADIAGQAATWRGLDILKAAGCLVRVADLPSGMDPDDFIRSNGAEVFLNKIIAKALPLIDYQLKKAKEKYNINNTAEKVQYSRETVAILADIRDVLERDNYIQKVAEELSLPETSLRGEIRKHKKSHLQQEGASRSFDKNRVRGVRGRETSDVMLNDNSSLSYSSDSPSEIAEKRLILILLTEPLWIKEVAEKIKKEDFNNKNYAEIIGKILSLESQGKPVTLAVLVDSFQDVKIKRILAALIIEEGTEKDLQKKVIGDCLKKIKLINIRKERKNIEIQLQEMEKKKEKEENITKLLQEWKYLKEEEERFSHSPING